MSFVKDGYTPGGLSETCLREEWMMSLVDHCFCPAIINQLSARKN